jgi:hypothetical protein
MLKALLLLVLALAFTASCASAQTLLAGGGAMELLAGGYTYTLLPVARGDTTLLPLVTGYEGGWPMSFSLAGRPGQTFQLSFSVEDIVYCGGRVAVSFAPDAMHWDQQNAYLDPNHSQPVTCDSTGSATWELGLTMAIPQTSGGFYYTPYVTCLAIDAVTGDTLTAVTAVEAYAIGFHIPPSSTLQNLSRGYRYTLSPEPVADNVIPRVNGRERGGAASITLYSDGADTAWLSWILPTALSSDEAVGELPCSFGADAVRVRETGERLDPHGISALVFGMHCSLTLDVGFTVDISSSAAPDGYSGSAVAFVSYTGNLKGHPSRTPADGNLDLHASVLNEEIPARYELLQNYPNPFNPRTTIRYGLTRPEAVVLTIHDVLGHLVATLVNGMQYAGWHTVEWQAENLPTGVYFYEVRTPSRTMVRKLLLTK